MINYFTIFGERCSGTNYIKNIIELNFNIKHTDIYGHKHFFGFNSYNNPDVNKTLFISIVRNPYSWLNSLYNNPHHFSSKLLENKNTFLNNEIISYHDNGNEILEDRNIYTKNRYKNIFELRNTKLKYMLEDLPQYVKFYIIIKYEDLVYNFDNTMKKFNTFPLCFKENYPINSNIDYKYKNKIFDKKKLHNKKYIFLEKEIFLNKNFNKKYEEILGYL